MVMVGGEGRDDGSAELVRLAMRQVERGHLLQMIMQQPGVVEQALQDQGLPARHRAALAAHQRACRQLRTHRLVGAARQGGTGTGGTAAPPIESAAAWGVSGGKTPG